MKSLFAADHYALLVVIGVEYGKESTLYLLIEDFGKFQNKLDS